MNRSKLKSEGQKWVKDDIISEQQLDQILASYKTKDPNTIILLFAVLLSGLGFLTFITSDWARVPHFSRIAIIIAFKKCEPL
ncbi:DUF2157 domain-containing protein [Virgibacillus necropolis]|uniref:DUF2157 domain-containing protein n=1 Tax=Virgibacillus necropolis TaxID=163877 RepID=UPI00384C2141